MADLFDDPAWRQLRADTARAPLHGVAWALNRLNRAWDEGDVTPARLGLPKSGLGHLPAKNPAYRWATAECMRQGLLWSKAHSYGAKLEGDVTVADVARLVHRATWAHLERAPTDITKVEAGGSIHDFIFPTLAPQFHLSRSSSLRVGQALWMFEEAPRRRAARIPAFPSAAMTEAFTKALGMPVRDFVRIVLLLFGTSNSQSPTVRNDYYDFKSCPAELGLFDLESGTPLPRLPRVLGAISAPPATMRNWMKSSGGIKDSSDVEFLYAPNPLLRFPFVRPFLLDDDRCIAPVPSLVLEWLYEPMIGFLYDTLPFELRRPHYGHVFEEYVGLVLERHGPDAAPWVSEAELVPASGGRVVDWARAFEGSVVLVDAKRCFIQPATRYRMDDDDWVSLAKALLTGVEQGAAFWKSVRRGEVAALTGAAELQPLLVLVSQGDTSLFGHQEQLQKQLAETAETCCPGLKVVLLSLDQLQHVMINWRINDLEWLPRTLLRIAVEGRRIIDAVAPHRAEGPLFAAVAEVLSGRTSGVTVQS